jgi:hypothetical protein
LRTIPTNPPEVFNNLSDEVKLDVSLFSNSIKKAGYLIVRSYKVLANVFPVILKCACLFSRTFNRRRRFIRIFAGIASESVDNVLRLLGECSGEFYEFGIILFTT